jgi:hypothetical protein
VTFGDVVPRANHISILATFTSGLHRAKKDMHMCTEQCDRKKTWAWDDKKQVKFVKALINLADVAQHVREATACDTPDSLDLACGLLNSLSEKAARKADMVKLSHNSSLLALPFPCHALPTNLPDLPDLNAAAGLLTLAAVV